MNVYTDRKVLFDGVTGFSNVVIEWKYDKNRWGKAENEADRKRRGLKGQIKYDETFYIALIKNYQDMGWYSQADDVFFTYRSEKRKRRNFWPEWVEFVLLEVPFGYGVNPYRLLFTFLFFVILFGFYYFSQISAHSEIRQIYGAPRSAYFASG